MKYPEDKVADVAKLGPVKASELLDRGRAGDLDALADFAVYSVYRGLLRRGLSPSESMTHTKTIFSNIDLKVYVSK